MCFNVVWSDKPSRRCSVQCLYIVTSYTSDNRPVSPLRPSHVSDFSAVGQTERIKSETGLLSFFVFGVFKERCLFCFVFLTDGIKRSSHTFVVISIFKVHLLGFPPPSNITFHVELCVKVKKSKKKKKKTTLFFLPLC